MFTDVTAACGIKVNVEKRPGHPEYGTQTPHGVAVEDFDGDGLQDILLVCFGEPHVQLFRNIGGLKFVDITNGSGLEIFKGWGTGAAVGDYNRDGKLDVYLTSVAWEQRTAASPKRIGKADSSKAGAAASLWMSAPRRACCWIVRGVAVRGRTWMATAGWIFS